MMQRWREVGGDRGLGRHGRFSTGPRTEAGKAVCSGNARRHGLSTYRPESSAIQELAEAIADHFSMSGQNADLISALAEADLRLLHIQQFIVSALCNTDHSSSARLSARMVDRYLREAEARRRATVRDFLSALDAGRP
jgi:hypothetical protein